MIQNVRYSNSLPSGLTLPFENWTPILSSIQMNLVFRWLLYSHVYYNLRVVIFCSIIVANVAPSFVVLARLADTFFHLNRPSQSGSVIIATIS